MSPLNIIFAGSGEFGLPTLQGLLHANHRVVRVITQPDKPAGRGKHLAPTPIARYADEHDLPVLRTASINAETLPPADVMVVIAFGQKIAPAIVVHPRLGSVNLHASLLPKYRGAAPINWAILRGESETGNSVIRLAQKMDAGAILGQSRLAIRELETAGELHDRLAMDGAPLVLSVLDKLAGGAAEELQQDESKATLAPKLGRESAKLDFAQPAEVLALQIRGFHPWPGCHVRLMDDTGKEQGRVTLVRARVTGPVGEPAGMINAAGLVAAGDGIGLEIVELQPEGKRPMPLSAYRNGHAWEPGMRLEAI